MLYVCVVLKRSNCHTLFLGPTKTNENNTRGKRSFKPTFPFEFGGFFFDWYVLKIDFQLCNSF